MIGFIVGLFIGAALGVLAICLVQSGDNVDPDFINQLITENAHLREWREGK